MLTLDDHQLAAHIATAAGRRLTALRGSPLLVGSALGAAGDAMAHRLIMDMLTAARPGDAVVSEEGRRNPVAPTAHRLWIVDPLDGTREYAEAGWPRDDWAVHVALTEGGHPTACAVALPAMSLTFETGRPPALAPSPPGPLKILVSRTRAPEVARRVAATLHADLLPMGSAGAKAMAVLQGRAHAYLHAGGLSVWDSCAPVGVALAAGLHASRLDGSACDYGLSATDSSMPDLLICRPEWAGPLLEAVAARR